MVVAKQIKNKKKKRKPAEDDNTIPAVGEYNEPPNEFTDYCYIIYGQKGIGKTTLCSQLSEKTLVCMFEDRYNTKIRMKAFPSKTVEEMENGEPDPWANFKGVVENAMDPDANVDIIVVDSVDLAYQACMNHICKENGISHPNDMNDYGATWNEVSAEFRSVMESIRKHSGLCLVLISHCTEDRFEINSASKADLKKHTVYSPSCAKKPSEYVKQACDFAFFYGKHKGFRAMHIRWEDNIWTACGNDDRFLDTDGQMIAALEIPSKETAGQAVRAAFENEPFSLVIEHWEGGVVPEAPEDDSEETPAPTRKKKVKRKSV
jgi:hypothetical protein